MAPGSRRSRPAMALVQALQPPPPSELPSVVSEHGSIDLGSKIHTFDQRVEWCSVASLLRMCAEVSNVTRDKPQSLFQGCIVDSDVHRLALVRPHQGYNLFEHVEGDGR